MKWPNRNNIKYLLYEDDCAPDAREYFFKDMKKKFDLEYSDFKNYGKFREIDNGMTLEWEYNGYILEISADDPYYKLRREDD